MGRRRKSKKSGPPPLAGGLPPPPAPGELGLPPPPSPADMNLPAPPPPSSEGLPVDLPKISGRKSKKTVEEDEVEVSVVQEPMPAETRDEVEESDEHASKYASLWERKSEKPLKQMYGQIDRMNPGEIGSLLDRYSERFGKELDRELIVLRRRELTAKRGSEPYQEEDSEVPESIPAQESEKGDASSEIEVKASEVKPAPPELDSDLEAAISGELNELEERIRPLHQEFKLAKQRNQTKKIRKVGTQLKPLVARRRLLIDVRTGARPVSDLKRQKEEHAPADDEFEVLVGIVDELLAKLPEESISSFMEHDDFKVYQKVGGSPLEASDDERRAFFKVVDSRLLDLPEQELEAFTTSDAFQIYERVGARLS